MKLIKTMTKEELLMGSVDETSLFSGPSYVGYVNIEKEIIDNMKEVIHYCGSCSQALPNHKLTCAYNEHSPKKYFLNLGLDNVKWYNKLWSWVISKLKQ